MSPNSVAGRISHTLKQGRWKVKKKTSLKVSALVGNRNGCSCATRSRKHGILLTQNEAWLRLMSGKTNVVQNQNKRLTSTRPCKILTNMTKLGATWQAPGMKRFRNADIPIALPNILQCKQGVAVKNSMKVSGRLWGSLEHGEETRRCVSYRSEDLST